MPKSVKAVRNARAQKTFRNKKNLSKRMNQKLKRKTGKPTGSWVNSISDFSTSYFRHILAPIWDKKKSVHANMKKAGLILNPNKLVKLHQNEPEAMDIEEALNPSLASDKPEKKVSRKNLIF